MTYQVKIYVTQFFDVEVDADSLEDAQDIAMSLYADVRLFEARGVVVSEESSAFIDLVPELEESNSFNQ